jgi:hypothetical protein
MSISEIIVTFHAAPRLDTDFNHESWQGAQILKIDQDWRGRQVPADLYTAARLLWSKDEILFGFECRYTELDIDQEFDVREERHALWDRDVCEAFVRSPIEPHEKYYREFEVAPTGQWCDLIVDRSQMWHDWQWRSGMQTVCEIDEADQVWRGVMAIPFEAFECVPSVGDIWRANLFRITRLNGVRQYLTLSPTFTETPDFHVTESFVDLRFVE